MTTYESKQKQLFRSQSDIYEQLSDLTRLEPYLTAIPKEHLDKVKDLSFTSDSVSFSISPVGLVTLSIVDREEPKMLKFGSENLPVKFNFWIQLVSVSEYDTRMKLTLKADIPLMLRPMIGNKLTDGIEKLADMIVMAINR